MKPAARLCLFVVGLTALVVAATRGAELVTSDGMQAELSKITSVKILLADDGTPTKFVLRFAFATTTTTTIGEVEKERTTTTTAEVDLALHGGDRSFGATVVLPDGKKKEVFLTDALLAQLLTARAMQEYKLRNPPASPVDALAIVPPIINRTKREPLTSKSAPVAANK